MSATNALVPRHNDLPAPSEWQTILEMGKVLHQSGILPEYIRSPAAAVAIIQKGREVGVPPMAAIAGISFVKGKATMGAELMHACIIRDHGSAALYVRESTDTHCAVAYNRPGLPGAMEFTFTIEMAKAAGLTGTGRNGEPSMYTKYPAAMLRSRAISYVAKMAFPDSIGGMLTSEEMGAPVTVNAEGTVEVVDEPTEPPLRARTIEAGASPMPQAIERKPAANFGGYCTEREAARIRELAPAKGIDLAGLDNQPLAWRVVVNAVRERGGEITVAPDGGISAKDVGEALKALPDVADADEDETEGEATEAQPVDEWADVVTGG